MCDTFLATIFKLVDDSDVMTHHISARSRPLSAIEVL